MADRGHTTVYEIEHASGHIGPPKVAEAFAANPTTVRIRFDRAMNRDNPLDADDVLNPSNYSFGVTGGVSVTPDSVAINQNFPTIVDVTLNREMTNGAAYDVTVSNVVSSTGELIGAENTAEFGGLGARPGVASATALDGVIVQVVFDEPMNQSTLTDPLKYDFTPLDGGDAITADSVDVVSSTEVRIWLFAPMSVGKNYRVEVSDVYDLANNIISDVNNWADFVGVEVQTKLTNVEATSSTRLRLTFEKPMNRSDLLEESYYFLTAVEAAVAIYLQSVVVPGDTYPTYVDLIVSEMTNGKTYNCEVSTAVRDRWGVHLSATFNDLDFSGVGEAPEIKSVKATAKNRVLVTFTEPMRDNADIRDPAKYSFDKGLGVQSVLNMESDQVELITDEQTPGEIYTLTVLP
jgi:hypothetical protein